MTETQTTSENQSKKRKRDLRLRHLWRKCTIFEGVSDNNFRKASRWVFWTATGHITPFALVWLISALYGLTLSFHSVAEKGTVVALALGLLIATFSQTSQSRKQSDFLQGAAVVCICVSAFMVATPELNRVIPLVDGKKRFDNYLFTSLSAVMYIVSFFLAYGAQLLRLEFADEVESLNVDEESKSRENDLLSKYEEE